MSTQPQNPLAQWRVVLWVWASLTTVLVAVYWSTLSVMVMTWGSSDSFQHCYFVLLFVLYLLWDRKDVLASHAPQQDWWGIILLFLGGMAWLVGYAGSVQLIQQLAFVIMIEGVILAIVGRVVFRVMLFPMLFLFLLVPMGEFMVPLLQDWTAIFLTITIDLIGYDSSSDGYFITVIEAGRSYVFEVAKECSGIRYLTVMVSIGLASAYLFFDSFKHRALIVGLSALVPIVANWLRALGIVVLNVETEGRHGADVDHLIYGFWFFLVVLIAFIGLAWFMARNVQPTISVDTADRPVAIEHSLQPILIGAALALVLLPAGWTMLMAQTTSTPAVALSQQHMAAQGWRQVQDVQFDWHANFAGADETLQLRYRRGLQDIDVYIARYHRQTEDAELVRYGNIPVAAPWLEKKALSQSAHWSGAGEAAIRRYDRNGRKRLVAQWYRVAGDWTSSQMVAKALTAKARLLGGPQQAYAVVVSARYFEEPDNAILALQGFLNSFELAEQDI